MDRHVNDLVLALNSLETWLPKQARCHVSAIHEGSRTSSETQKLLVQAIEETVRNVKFFLKANSVIEEQKSTVRFAGTCS